MILADAYEAFLFDLDGVVWRGDVPVHGATSTITELRERGRKVVFVTNNSMHTTREYAVKLFRMKLPTETNDVITSGHAVIAELKRLGLEKGDRVHVCAGEGLNRLLIHNRFVPVTDTTDVQAVVVGWNPKGTYDDIRKAADLARSGVHFIASNADATYPTDKGLMPGTGAIVAAIEVASGAKATVVGKPRPELFQLGLERAGVPAERTLFCGDRASSDIVGAHAAGLAAALVLTGVTRESDLATMGVTPEYILDDTTDLLRDLPVPTEILGDNEVRLDTSIDGDRLLINGVFIPPNFEKRASWTIARQLLVSAIASGKSIEASDSVRPYLERIGAEVGPQMKLFRT